MLPLEGSLTDWNLSAMQQRILLLGDRILLKLSRFISLFYCCIFPYICIFCIFCIICVGNIWCFMLTQWDWIILVAYHFLFNYRGISLSYLKLAQILINEDMSQIQGLHKIIVNALMVDQRKLKYLKVFGVKENNVILTNPFVLLGNTFCLLPCTNYEAIICKKIFLLQAYFLQISLKLTWANSNWQSLKVALKQ